MVSMENLLMAWDGFKKGKGKKMDVQIFEYRLEDNLFSLHEDLVHKRYKHGRYSSFYVHDPKLRHIHKAQVRDRIVHHAIFQCLNPIFEPTFIADSYSCRKEKGTHRAVKRLQLFTRKVEQTYGRCFVLKCDIKKFFPTLDHHILFDIISRKIKDPDVLWLIQANIASFVSEFSSEGSGKKGAPIGNLTSQLFANIYMNELDQHIKCNLKVKYYIRYTDDFVLIHNNQEYLVKLKDKIDDFLQDKLKLLLHPNKVHICKYKQGIDFLGYVTLPKAQVLRTKTKKRIFRKFGERVEQFHKDKITEETLLQVISSYFGVLSHANTYELRQKLYYDLLERLKWPGGK